MKKLLAAIAFATDASRGLQTTIAAARSAPTEEVAVRPVEFSRCYCRVCREADTKEKWGAYQLRML